MAAGTTSVQPKAAVVAKSPPQVPATPGSSGGSAKPAFDAAVRALNAGGTRTISQLATGGQAALRKTAQVTAAGGTTTTALPQIVPIDPTPPGPGPYGSISPSEAAAANANADNLARDQRALIGAPPGSQERDDALTRIGVDALQTSRDARDAFSSIGRGPGQSELFSSQTKFDNTRVGLNAVAGTTFEPQGNFSRVVDAAEQRTLDPSGDFGRVTEERFRSTAAAIVRRGEDPVAVEAGQQLSKAVAAEIRETVLASSNPAEVPGLVQSLKDRAGAGLSDAERQSVNTLIDSGAGQVIRSI